MQVRFWGIRSSVPSASRAHWRYGGHTPCIEVRADDQVVILDAGTGICELGRALVQEFPRDLCADILLTHYHWGHLQGLPFFEPLHRSGSHIGIFGPHPRETDVPGNLVGVLNLLFHPPFFQLSLTELASVPTVSEVDEGSSFPLDAVRVRTARLNHPQGAVAYRIEHEGISLVYAPDHLPGDTELDAALCKLCSAADLLIADAGSLRGGASEAGWKFAVNLAREAGVRQLVLFHDEPTRPDVEIDELLHEARRTFPSTWAASEGLALELWGHGIEVRSDAPRLGARVRPRLAAEVEVRQDNRWVRESVHLESLSFYGGYFVSDKRYLPGQPVNLVVRLRPDRNIYADQEWTLRGVVLRAEPLTANGTSHGVAVHFPGRAPQAQEAAAGVRPANGGKVSVAASGSRVPGGPK